MNRIGYIFDKMRCTKNKRVNMNFMHCPWKKNVKEPKWTQKHKIRYTNATNECASSNCFNWMTAKNQFINRNVSRCMHLNVIKTVTKTATKAATTVTESTKAATAVAATAVPATALKTENTKCKCAYVDAFFFYIPTNSYCTKMYTAKEDRSVRSVIEQRFAFHWRKIVILCHRISSS